MKLLMYVVVCACMIVVGCEEGRHDSHWAWDIVDIWKEIHNNTLVYMEY